MHKKLSVVVGVSEDDPKRSTGFHDDRAPAAFADTVFVLAGAPVLLADRVALSSDASHPYLMKSISEYFGSGHRSSATSFSSRSATSRVSSIAAITVSRM